MLDWTCSERFCLNPARTHPLEDVSRNSSTSLPATDSSERLRREVWEVFSNTRSPISSFVLQTVRSLCGKSVWRPIDQLQPQQGGPISLSFSTTFAAISPN